MIWRLVAVVIATFRLALQSCKQRELAFLGSCHGNLRSPLLGIRGCKPIICLGLASCLFYFLWVFDGFFGHPKVVIHNIHKTGIDPPSLLESRTVPIVSQGVWDAYWLPVLFFLQLLSVYQSWCFIPDMQNQPCETTCQVAEILRILVATTLATLSLECRNLHHL